MIVESFLVFLGKIFCFTSFVSNKGSFPKPLSEEDEKKYVEAAKQGDQQAREMLIRHNLRLVAHVVKKYSNAGEADDLISVGSIGLIKGIGSFEYGKGSQLATYCAKCIDNEILMHIRANKKHRGTASLFVFVFTQKTAYEITLMDILPHTGDSVLTQVETKILYEKVLEVVEKVLSPREKEIIQKRYGIGHKSMTQLQISKQLKISRSYVSRIEKRAIYKISKEVMQKSTF
ncbi:MAG: RNA polymerase sporulation sigma factor SigK [Firmicutes bacterium]|nr:RNA polymerase sporulation sigma factor SigK [Bacillota bacterium]